MSLAFVATMGLGAGCSCGGTGSGNQQDAAADSTPQFDAVHDQGPVPDDAGPTCGTFQDLSGCGFELNPDFQCTVAKPNSDECGDDLDCVDTGLFGLQCLRKCNCSAECGFNTICLPSKSTDYSDPNYATQIIGNAKGHCFYSFCGGAGDDTSPFGNGNFFGACQMGADGFIKPGKVDTRPGTCFPMSTDVPEGYVAYGLCQQAGDQPRGGACSFDTNQCTKPGTYDACAVGTTCTGRQGNPVGTCARLCDPNATGFIPAVPGECAADSDVPHDQYCQDSSDYQWGDCVESDGGVEYGNPTTYNYVGFCVDSQGCDLFAAANNCASVVSDGGVALNGCEPTSPVNAYGLCGTTGSVGLGGTCNNTLLCAQGLVCITKGGAANGTCEQYCGLGPNAAKWPCTVNGEFCDRILYGSDTNPQCWNDPWTLGYGICKPDTRQDAGVQQDGATDA
ncbi:MAG: hypothetical protein HY906_00730 [Deltaproteobacteria bacterium]|nr:hypothetical protein [Deltaproteobacteria bacterium]